MAKIIEEGFLNKEEKVTLDSERFVNYSKMRQIRLDNEKRYRNIRREVVTTTLKSSSDDGDGDDDEKEKEDEKEEEEEEEDDKKKNKKLSKQLSSVTIEEVINLKYIYLALLMVIFINLDLL